MLYCIISKASLCMKVRHEIEASHSQRSSSACELSHFKKAMLRCALYACDSSKQPDCGDLYTSYLLQSDDHGAVAENIDSTWEAQLRLGQVSNRYTHWNLDICKTKFIFEYSKEIQDSSHEALQKRMDELVKGVTEKKIYQLPFWKLFRKK